MSLASELYFYNVKIQQGFTFAEFCRELNSTTEQKTGETLNAVVLWYQTYTYILDTVTYKEETPDSKNFPKAV